MPTNLSTNPLLPIVEEWWLMHKEKINGVAAVTPKVIVNQALTSLCFLQQSDYSESDACKIPARISSSMAELCNEAQLADKQKCVAAICQVLSDCAVIIEDRKLIHIQGELQIKIREYEPVEDLQDDFFDYIPDERFDDLQSWLKSIWSHPISLNSEFEDVPDRYFSFFNLDKVDNVRAEAAIICEGLKEETASYKDEKPEKGKIINRLFGPYLRNKKMLHMPEYTQFKRLFADKIGGMSDNGYRPIREEMNAKYNCD